jgi:hypothetical protein
MNQMSPKIFKTLEVAKSPFQPVFSVDTLVDYSIKNPIFFSPTGLDVFGKPLTKETNLTKQARFFSGFVFTQADDKRNNVPMMLESVGHPIDSPTLAGTNQFTLFTTPVCIANDKTEIDGLFLFNANIAYRKPTGDGLYPYSSWLKFVECPKDPKSGNIYLHGHESTGHDAFYNFKIKVQLFSDKECKNQIIFNYKIDLDQSKNYIGGLVHLYKAGGKAISEIAAVRFTVDALTEK